MNTVDLLFYLLCFLIYLIPALVLQVFFIVQSKADKPHPVWSAIVNFLLLSLVIFIVFFCIAKTGPGAGDIFIAFPFVEIALLIMMPFAAIALSTLSPLLNHRIGAWKAKQTYAGIISALTLVCIYIGLGFLVFYHLM